MSTNKIIPLIFLVSVFTLSLFVLIKFNNSLPLNFLPEKVPSATANSKEKFKYCVRKIGQVYYSETYRFFAELDLCMTTYFSIDYKKLDNFPNGATGERKVFLPMAKDFRKEECRWLTIGIGGLVAAEEQFHAKYPNCKIYGVEPANQGNFSKTGEVLTAGVGLEDNSKNKDFKIISLPKVLDEFVHSRLVHYLSIDIESYEMIILQELIGTGKFANGNITFCQIDAELHNPKQGGQHELAANINRIKWIIDFLDDSSPYIPIFTVSYLPAHKVTFVNVENSECEKAFKIKSYLEK
jgi:hypothetical protein